MRVAFLTSELHPGYGWGRYGLDLSQALVAQGVRVIALTQRTTPPPAQLPEGLEVRPVLPQLMPRPRGFLARSVPRLPNVIGAVMDADVLHVIAEPYAPLAALIAGSRPVVVTAHGTYVPQTSKRRGVGWAYRRAYHKSFIVAVSHYTAEQVKHALHANEPPIVIQNGVHFDQWQLPGLVPTKNGPTVLASGGVKPRKGTLELVEAMARVRESIPDVQLVVTGQQEQGYMRQVQEAIAHHKLDDHVTLAGMVSDAELRGWYQHADVFALPSLNVGGKFEGFGLVYLEAGACGLPVIGTTGSGAAEAIRENETGLLVPQRDIPALADAITRLMQDADLQAHMGAAGRTHAKAHDWSTVARRMRALYRWIES